MKHFQLGKPEDKPNSILVMTVLIKTLFHFVFAENYKKRNDYVMKLPFLVENTNPAIEFGKPTTTKTLEKSQSHHHKV